MSFIIKLLFILGMAILPAIPFVLEYVSFRRECAKKVGYRRFWLVAWAALYIVLITVALCLVRDFLAWLESVSFVRQLVSALAIGERTVYFGKVIVALLVNFAIGMLYWLACRVIRAALSKSSLVEPAKKDGEFSFAQKLERRAVAFFHQEVFFFVGKILRYLSIALSAAYILFFIVCQIPGVFGASWIPYNFISMLFEAGCVYPSLVLIGFWSLTYFFSGVERLREECPQFLQSAPLEGKKVSVDLESLNRELKKCFRDFYVGEIKVPGACDKKAAASHLPVTKQIRAEVERDPRNAQPPRELYLDVTDRLIGSGASLLINGNFFSGFSMYFLRYLAAVIARGDNAVLVCNSEAQIAAVYDYLRQAFAENVSLYCPDRDGKNVYDDPVWRIAKVSGERGDKEESSVDDSNVLVTSLGYLCSDRFEDRHGGFAELVDVVVFVDTLGTIQMFDRQLAVLNTRLQHITRKNLAAAKNDRARDLHKTRYLSRQVRYICFDDSRVPGLDKVVKNMLGVDFDTADAMYYGPQTSVFCYNYEPRLNENGRRSYPQLLDIEEEIGAVMNMAVFCLAKGADKVTVFTDDAIPYANILETLASNSGKMSVRIHENNLQLNKPLYDPDGYSVVIAVDSGDDLPAAARRYASMLSGSKALLILFTRPYLWRRYDQDKIGEIWAGSSIRRIPVEEGTRREMAQRILVKANAGGIFRSEVIRLAAELPEFDAAVAADDVNEILRRVLENYGLSHADSLDLFRYFEYTAVQDFDAAGRFRSDTKIVLRRKGQLFEAINGLDRVSLVVGDEQYVLPVPRSLLRQNFIAGQNLIHNGCIYHILKIDTAAARIYARLASGGKNDEAWQYIQDREYHMEMGDVQYLCPVKHVVLHREEGDVAVEEAYVSVMRAPMEVLTHGYYEVDPHTAARSERDLKYHKIDDLGNDVLSMQAYRRYGSLSKPVCPTESVFRAADFCAYEKEALVMSVRLCGKFGADIRKTMQLAAVMLNEILRSMFPSVADSVVVCPDLRGERAGEDAAAVLCRQPALRLDGANEEEPSFRLLIIEDCPTELGVVSALMSAGDDILNTLFRPIRRYLQWYLSAPQKDAYLYGGLDHAPDCFDFTSLQQVAELVSDDRNDLRFIDMNAVTEYTVCDFCGRRYAKGDDFLELPDGRKMCRECRENLAAGDRKTLELYIGRIRIFLESAYGISMQEEADVCFEATAKIVNTLKRTSGLSVRGADIPLRSYIDEQFRIHIEEPLPAASLTELLIRELTHLWQLRNLPELAAEYAEGLCAFVSVQYLQYIGQDAQAAARTRYYESTASVSGVGYRKLVRELLQNLQYRNNPFRYLSALSGAEHLQEGMKTPPTIGEECLGKAYTPSSPDRAAEGELRYFYYDRLSPPQQKVYSAMVKAILAHEEKADADGIGSEDIFKASHAIRYDRPELFWFSTCTVRGNEILLHYGASAEEAQALQKQIDEAVKPYLEGITDAMSAYDVAIRLYSRLIAAIDYDTVALEKQEAEGGPKEDAIDYLRTICGAFLRKSAVCEGYARAIQYLLQKCGVECAEAVGDVYKDDGSDGEAHAWNILKIDGDYYYMDVTWDDRSNTNQPIKIRDFEFSYFCITTKEMQRTRKIESDPVEMPDCTATRGNYYTHNGLVLERYDPDRIKQIAAEAAAAKSTFFTFKCRDKALYAQALKQLCVEGADCYEAIKAAAKKDKRIRTNKFRYNPNTELWTITIWFAYDPEK